VRASLSVALAIAGAVLLPFAVGAFYAREQIVDPSAFHDRALTALDEPAVRNALESEIEFALQDRFGAQAVAAVEGVLRPRIEAVIASDEFRRVFIRAVMEARLRFLVWEENDGTVDLSAAAPILKDELRSSAPALARRLPSRLRVELNLLRRDDSPGGSLLTNADVRLLGALLPLLSLAAFVGSLALGRPRARALIVIGMAVAVSAVALGLGVALGKQVAVDRLEGQGRLPEAELRRAGGAVFDVYVDDLYLWALGLAVAGVLVVAAGWALGRRRGRYQP
jgi:hypothetical protein